MGETATDLQTQDMSDRQQFATFKIGDQTCGIRVEDVQEIVRGMPLTKVPLAPGVVKGLINLRGQIATAIDMRQLFSLQEREGEFEPMNVICTTGGTLLSLQVDEIGEVLEVSKEQYENSPETIPENIRRFMDGIYKTDEELISVIKTKKILNYLNKKK